MDEGEKMDKTMGRTMEKKKITKKHPEETKKPKNTDWRV